MSPLAVKAGDFTLLIRHYSRRKHGAKYDEYRFSYRDAGGKLVRKSFASLDKAREEAQEIAALKNSGRLAALELRGTDGESYITARRALAGSGINLHDAVHQFVSAREALGGGGSLLEAAKYYALRHREHAPMPIGDVAAELLTERKADGASIRYIQTLRAHVTRFAKSFQTNIGSVKSEAIEEWLRKLNAGLRTRNNFRMSIVTLFHFARSKGYLAKGFPTEADLVERRKVPASIAKVYGPEQMAALLKAADEMVQPIIAISGFAGIRSATVGRLSWENIKWGQRVIEIPAAISKTNRRYLVPLLPNLAAWLSPYRGRKGRIAAGMRLEERLRETFKRAGIERLSNGFRDSFISYRVAVTQNLPQVAFEAGNSVEMIRSKYLEARTEGEAKAWFSIMPTAPANVTQLDFAANQ